MIGGVRLEYLRATDVSGLTRDMGTLPEVMPGENVTALEAWVDGQGVVRQLNVEFVGSVKMYDFSPGALARLKRDAQGQRALLNQLLGPARQGVTVTVHAESASVSVSFTRIGQPEVITAPKGAADVYGLG